MPDAIENWLPIPEHDGYLVSDLGRVMSINCKRRTKGTSIIMHVHNCGDGYLQVKLAGNKHPLVHSLVMKAFFGPRPDKMQINHKSGVKTDNRLENLEYCTASQNMQHSYDNGRDVAHGEIHCKAKLKLADILDIREKISSGRKQLELAKFYSVGQSTISRIAKGKRWNRTLKEIGCAG